MGDTLARLEMSIIEQASRKGDEFVAYVHGEDGLLNRLQRGYAEMLERFPLDRVALHFDVEPDTSSTPKLRLSNIELTRHKGESLFWAECLVTDSNFYSLDNEARWRSLYALVGTFLDHLGKEFAQRNPQEAALVGELKKRTAHALAEHETAGLAKPAVRTAWYEPALYALLGGINALTKRLAKTK
jgi:hypothetical protein